MSFSTYFKELRKNNRLTQAELASILNITETSVANIEKNRVSALQQKNFLSLAKYVKDTPENIAYKIFFQNDIEEYGVQISEIHKQYLARMYSDRCIIAPATSYNSKNGEKQIFGGSFWLTGCPYYKVLLAESNRSDYYSAINSQDKEDNLRKAIFANTLFIENLLDPKDIKEIRFILDNNNEFDRLIFKEIKKTTISNLGKEYAISYVLFSLESKKQISDSKIHYVTNRSSTLQI